MTATTPELLAELDTCLTDSVRRASNRAEHIRLTRIQQLLGQLKAQLGVSSTDTPSSTAPAA